MALTSHDPRLFGLDLRSLWSDLCRPWLDMHRWPVLSWLRPTAPVHLWNADGSSTVWLGETKQTRASRAKVRFDAIELPEDILLRRHISLPALSENALADAVALEATSASPFSPDDLAWGYSARTTAGNSSDVEVILASRRHIETYLKEQATRSPSRSNPEVWVVSAQQTPIVMSGYGEAKRARYLARWHYVGYALLLLAFGIATAIALTPTIQLRMTAIEAVNAYSAVHKRAAPALSQRENAVKSMDRVTVLRDLLADRVDPLGSMDFLTRVLPDDTTLLSLQVQGTKISLSGQTVNTAALMQQLGTQKGVRDVRAPTPATKPLGTLKESFSIEFTLDPKVLDATRSTAVAAAQAASNPSVAASAPQPSPAASSLATPASKPTTAVFSTGGTAGAPATTASKAKP